MTSIKPYEIKLINDYRFDEVASAMQKCIRRNLEYEACWWAYIIHESKYHKYVWKRLLIIASEDIGNANPMLPFWSARCSRTTSLQYRLLTEVRTTPWSSYSKPLFTCAVQLKPVKPTVWSI